MTQFAEGTSCTPCLAQGHFCPAFDYDDSRRIVCVSYLDEVPCKKAKSPTAPPTARSGVTAAPTKRQYFRKAAVKEVAPEAICPRCFRAAHEGDCVRNHYAKPVVPAEQRAAVMSLDPSRIKTEIVSVDSIPGRRIAKGIHDVRMAEFKALPPKMALKIPFPTRKEAELYAQRFQNAMSRAKIRSSYRVHESTAFFWRREK